MDNEPKQAEVVEEVNGKMPLDLALVPGSLSDLANRLGQGVEIIRARAQILEIARKAAIRMTSPEDWLLFKDPQGRVVGFLQDCGCDRVRDIFGIEVYKVSRPEKIVQPDGSYMYIITGSGKCQLTQQSVEGVEGGRNSKDDFITRAKPPLEGAAMELAVRKAARANLDGSITRELAGLKSVPLEEIEAAYSEDSTKTRARFREGRGFGAQAERSQAGERPPGHVDAPVCPDCNVDMVLRKGAGKSGPYAFWGCPNFKEKGCKQSVEDSKWQETLAKKTKPSGPDGNGEGIPAQLLELQKLVVLIVNTDKTLTPDTLCKKYFKLKAKGTEPAKELTYAEVSKLRGENQLNWMHGTSKQIRKDYATILPPEEPAESQEELPL